MANIHIRRNSPWVQNLVSALCLFLTAGIYHAITGLGAGAGKPTSIKVATTTNAILYVIFAIVGFFGGSCLNTLGPRVTYMIGIFGYPFYTTGLWYYDARGQEWYPLLGGVVLGFTAGLLWTAANFIQFAYPEEKRKGQFIGTQLLWLSLGSTVGAIIPFGINFHNTSSSGVPTSVYIIFVVLMLSAELVAFVGLIKPEDVVRDDGTHLAVFEAVTFREELRQCLYLLKDWRVLILILPLFSTEITLGIVPTFNAKACNLRTRSLNNVLYWVVGVPTSYLFQKVLDHDGYRRRTRGLIAVAINVALHITGWTLLLVTQKKFDITRHAPSPHWDWTSADYGYICSVMVIFGIVFYTNQMFVMWVVGALANDPRIAGRFGGFAKAMLSAGLAVAFGLEAAQVPYIDQTIIQITLQFVSFALMAWVIHKAVKDTNYFDEATVIPPKHVEIETIVGSGYDNSEGKSNVEVKQTA